MFSAEYGWMPKKKIKPKVKLFGGDDFKFFIFISIFIFCLAGLVLLITGDNVDFYLKYLMSEKGISLLPKPSSYLFFAGEDFEAISSFIIGLGKLNKKASRDSKGGDLVQVLSFFSARPSVFTVYSMISAA